MGFGNSILAGVTLVRESIRSPNYVAGVSGWAIKQDGSAEFNNVIVRGEIHIGTNPNTFNVDTAGNLWSGAATFAAANFSVSNTGLVSVRTLSGSEKIQFIDGNTAPFQWPTIAAGPNGAGGSRVITYSSGKHSALSRAAGLSLYSADSGGVLAQATLDAQTVAISSSPSSTTLTITGSLFAFTNGAVTTTSTLTTGNQITANAGIILGTSQFQSAYNTSASASWTNANFLCNAGAGNTAIAFHPGGVAPQFRCGNSVDIIYVRNSADSLYSTLQGILVNTSSRRDKQDIAPWPPAPDGVRSLMAASATPALDKLRALKPSTYRWDRAKALTTVRPRKLTGKLKAAAGRLDGNERLALETELVPHECGVDCAGSIKAPCYRVREWERGTLGLIAEDVFAIAPEVCAVGPDGNPDGLHSIGLAALAIAAVQELAELVDALNSRAPAPI